MTLKLSKSSVKANTKVKFSGTVTTAKGVAGAGTVKIMKRVSGVWKVWKTRQLNASGKYSITVKMTKKGTFYFRALMPGDSLNKTANSAASASWSSSKDHLTRALRARIRCREGRPPRGGRPSPFRGRDRTRPGPGPPRPPGRTPSPTLGEPSDVADSAAETANSLPNPTLRATKAYRLSRASVPLAPALHPGPHGPREHGSHVSGGTRHALRGDTQTEVTTPAL